MGRRWRFVEVDGVAINMELVTHVLVANEGNLVTLWVVGNDRPTMVVGEAAVRFRKWWEKKAGVYRC